jgi:hypothetical protein
MHRDCGEHMDISDDDVHALHVSNELQFARLFLNVARQSYDIGSVEAGDVALARARAAFYGATRVAHYLSELKCRSISVDLQLLERALTLLSAANATPHGANSDAHLEGVREPLFSFF